MTPLTKPLSSKVEQDEAAVITAVARERGISVSALVRETVIPAAKARLAEQQEARANGEDPTLDAAVKRIVSTVVAARVSPSEAALLATVAAGDGITVSSLIRRLAVTAARQWLGRQEGYR